MVPANRRYVIFEMSEVDLIDFGQVLQTSKDTLRLSNDGTKALIKYEPAPAQEEILYEEGDPALDENDVMYDSNVSLGDVKQTAIRVGDVKIPGRSGDEIPSSVGSLTTKSQGYTHFEILNELRGEEWVSPDIGIS